ncbi:MAG TPA: histidine ammonia-lyase [Candidatus Dormibacteraeota bacterium]|nr:histidine ammonia-lyase [Candidatus Dormibacteraeota bacterium]
MTVRVSGRPLTFAEVIAVARAGEPVELTDEALETMQRTRARVEELAEGEQPVYGISTGFGALAGTQIPPGQRSELQHALIRSHAAGMGDPVEAEVVRGMMLLRLRTLATGCCGVRPPVARALAALLNAGLVPAVPVHGSLGASGDLAPLAHVALCLIGEAETLPPGLRPLRLEAKEGLSLVNGTDGMLAMLVLACEDARLLFRTADVTAAMSVEALLGTDRVFAADLQALRPHPGQARSAANLSRLMAGSGIVASHRHSTHAVQDSYSMRCSPQVTGAARDTLDFAERVAERELAASIDNPVVLPDGRVESNGNFHGEPLAFACDFLAIASAEVGAIAERRVDRLLDPHRSSGLPPFLAPEPGVNSGLMLAQYTAAALVAGNRILANPASTDSVPTSGMQEDHVSMGWSAAVKLRQVLANLGRILAVELVCAARGLELRAPLHPAQATAAVRDLVHDHIGGAGPDRLVASQLAEAAQLVQSGAVVAAVERVLGPLQ